VPRRSVAEWAEIERDFVEGIAKDGKLAQATIRELSTTYHVSARAISKHSSAGSWVEKRQTFAKSAAQLTGRKEIAELLRERQVSNRSTELLARAYKNEAAKALDKIHSGDENAPPMTAAVSLTWLRAIREAQYIERLAGGESTALVESRQKTQSEIEDIQTRVATVGGPVSDEEAIAALGELSSLPARKLLEVWGLLPATPKKAATG
jgi:hypothetical protein